MRGILLTLHNKRILYFHLLLGGFFLLSSCSRSIAFNASSVVPAATGKVLLKKDRNKNYSIQVKIKNLADPANLNPPKSTYVVWMETPDHGIKNIGKLESSSGLFGGALKAGLKTVTAFEPQRFFITAENDAAVEYPGYQEVLTSDR